MFEDVEPIFDQMFACRVITKGLLNQLDGLSFSITKLLTKVDAICLLDDFGYFRCKGKSARMELMAKIAMITRSLFVKNLR